MIKKIIQISDLHIRKNTNRYEEYKEQFNKFLNCCRDEANGFEYDTLRCLIAGDIFHDKLVITNELEILVAWFLKEIEKIMPTILLCGNHDLNETNLQRPDSISGIINLINADNTLNIFYVDLMNNYKSGFFVDDNIVWVLYSIFDDFKRPNIEEMKLEGDNKKFIGLFHGPIIGSSSDTGFQMENGLNSDIFSGCQAVMCGDIHRHQILKFKNIDIVYPSSLIQQNYGENVTGHGYVVWNINENEITHSHHQIESDYGFYKFKISDIGDIEKNHEKIINL
jgi:DNA repair exonuclease SbcCD nuclease subunit